MSGEPRTLIDKLWSAHEIVRREEGAGAGEVVDGERKHDVEMLDAVAAVRFVGVDDGRGGSATQAYSLQVTTTPVNDPPVLLTPGIAGPAVIGSAYQVQLHGSDPNGDSLTFVAVSGLQPADSTSWLSLSADGLLSGTPPVGAAAELKIQLRLQDSRGALSGIYSLSLPVVAPAAPANEPPTITSTPMGPALTNQTYTYQVTAVDPDGDSSAITYSATVNGQTVAMSGGTFAYTPADTTPLAIRITATDAQGASAIQSFTLTVVAPAAPNLAPRFLSSPTGPAIVNQPYSYSITAEDPNVVVKKFVSRTVKVRA